jgi:dipeptidyl aminopeptidase/acylaminoacyl peptidase
VNLDGSGQRQLTQTRGVHEGIMSPAKTHIINTHSSIERPPATDLLTADGLHVGRLVAADASGVSALNLGEKEPFTALAADGATELYGVIYYPPGFDSTLVYPVIENQYGGPQLAIHQVGFTEPLASSGAPTSAALAAQGFIVVTVDGRGTPGRGKAFQDVVFGRFGHYHVEDHAHVLKQLIARHPFMDADRVAVVGRSWGGYQVLRCLLLEPKLYRVGVAICPVFDLEDHLAFAIEPYMGLPADRRSAFEAGSSFAIIDKLEGDLLIIHGTADVNAPISATFKMCEALARQNKPYELVVLPGADHYLRNTDLSHWRYMHDRIIQFLLARLARPGNGEASAMGALRSEVVPSEDPK